MENITLAKWNTSQVILSQVLQLDILMTRISRSNAFGQIEIDSSVDSAVKKRSGQRCAEILAEDFEKN